MGDFKKKNDLNEQIDQRAEKSTAKQDALKAITGSKKKKEKILSVRLYDDTWYKFSEINRKRGMTSGSVVNMLIADYINEYKSWLD